MPNLKLKVLNILIELSFYLILIFPMIFFGGVELWTKAFVHHLVFFILVLYLLKSLVLGRLIFFGKRFNLLVLLFLASLLLSTIFSVYVSDSLRAFILFFDAVALFTLSISEERGRRYFERVVFVLVSVGLLHVIYAVYKPLFLPIAAKGSWYINGTFYNHNHFVAYLELIFFLPIFMLYFKRNLVTWKRYFLWGATSLFSIAVLLSMSRGGIVSIMFSFLVLSLLLLKGKKRIILVSSLFFCPFWFGMGSTSLSSLKSLKNSG